MADLGIQPPSNTPDPQGGFSFKNMTPEQKKKFYLYCGIGAIIVIALITGIVMASRGSGSPTASPTPKPSPSPTPTPTPAEIPSMLDGIVSPTADATRHPMGVMIENTTDARPQAGLSDASIVYEAIAEGGITRYLAVFGRIVPDKVGPVRSARPYYVDWAEEYTPGSAYYVHAGGSPEALGKISGDRVYDLNHSSKGFQRFPRAGVASEHTLFAFPKTLYDVAKEKGYRTDSDFKPWKFKDDTNITNRPDAQTIIIPFSSKTYEAKFVYDKESNTYKRYLANAEHKDANNSKQLAPKSIIVMFTSYETVDAKNRQKVTTIGERSGKAFLDGKAIDIKWKKPSSPGRTIFTDAASGKEIEFNRGQIWIAVPKTGTTITVQ